MAGGSSGRALLLWKGTPFIGEAAAERLLLHPCSRRAGEIASIESVSGEWVMSSDCPGNKDNGESAYSVSGLLHVGRCTEWTNGYCKRRSASTRLFSWKKWLNDKGLLKPSDVAIVRS